MLFIDIYLLILRMGEMHMIFRDMIGGIIIFFFLTDWLNRYSFIFKHVLS